MESQWKNVPQKNNQIQTWAMNFPKKEKPKPPISSSGCIFQMPKIRETIDGRIIDVSVQHMSYLPIYKAYTIEELRYYDYVSFEKIPHWLD